MVKQMKKAFLKKIGKGKRPGNWKGGNRFWCGKALVWTFGFKTPRKLRETIEV
uniref:Uncharacterized protein n=1 Tax=Nelumbo nucifera TaxID=4432 RepID=A0A822Y4A7_NELNU|nr:TPA_asm: hypothetical protein HUJ06_028848 [Nelumbo nucifera]